MTGITRKQLKRHKGRAGGDVKTFAMMPSEVLRSEAHRTLPFPARAVLEVLADQYRGRNNGSLTLTIVMAREYGISNPYSVFESCSELEARGLIIKTRVGRRPVGKHGEQQPALSPMFAVTWWAIDPADPKDPHEQRSTLLAPDTWRKWKAKEHGLHWTVQRRDRTMDMDRKSAGPRKKWLARGGSPEHPSDSGPAIHGITEDGQTAIRRVAERGQKALSHGCLSDISHGGEAEAVEEEVTRSPLVGDLAGRWDELTGRALVLMREHGHTDGRAAKCFLVALKRAHGEPLVLTAISDYLELRPRNVETDEPIDSRDWIYWRVLELAGKPPVPGVKRPLVPDSSAVEALAPAAPLHDRPAVSQAKTLPEPFFDEMLARLAKNSKHYRPNVLLWDRINRFGVDQVRKAGIELEAKGLYGDAAQSFLRAYPFQPLAAEPPAATPEAAMQRIRKKAAKAPQYVGRPYYAFALELLVYESGKDAKWVGAYLGRKAAKYHWLSVEMAVRECEAKRLWGLRAIEHINAYFAAQEELIAGGQVRDDEPRTVH